MAGFSPLLAGTALLPVTAIMLLLSERSGALADHLGPRLPMSVGPVVAACGVLLMLRIGPGASYVVDVLPAVTLFGLGLSLIVAPLTSTVLAAASARHAGIASGIYNAVARTASLLAMATLPAVAGLSGTAYEHVATFAGGFRIAVVSCSVLLALGGIIAGVWIRNPDRTCVAQRADRRFYCAVDGPPIHRSPAW